MAKQFWKMGFQLSCRSTSRLELWLTMLVLFKFINGVLEEKEITARISKR